MSRSGNQSQQKEYKPIFAHTRLNRIAAYVLNQKMVETLHDVLLHHNETQEKAGRTADPSLVTLVERFAGDLDHWDEFDQRRNANS